MKLMATPEELSEEVARLMTEAIAMAAALHTILSETDDGECARIAVAGLQATEVGRDYLAANPLHH